MAVVLHLRRRYAISCMYVHTFLLYSKGVNFCLLANLQFQVSSEPPRPLTTVKVSTWKILCSSATIKSRRANRRVGARTSYLGSAHKNVLSRVRMSHFGCSDWTFLRAELRWDFLTRRAEIGFSCSHPTKCANLIYSYAAHTICSCPKTFSKNR